MAKPFEDRYEFLFLYEAKDCNPNGDPLDENRPRTDPVTGVATVTDVRIKRTIRDEFLHRWPVEQDRLNRGVEVLIRDTHKEDGYLAEGKDRADQFLTEEVKKAKAKDKVNALQQEVLKRCIDARLFGSTLPVDKGSLKVTGPVQFCAFNRSLHRVAPVLVQQTAAFAGGKAASQKSFAERQLLPYALIAVYGVGNEAAARTSQASDDDLAWMTEALWTGTANLATTSKMGHAPLLLLTLRYTAGHKLGQLQERIKLTSPKEDVALRGCGDFEVEVTNLIQDLTTMKPHLRQIEVRQDPRLRLTASGRGGALVQLLAAAGLEAVRK